MSFHMVRILTPARVPDTNEYYLGPCQFPTLGFVVSRYNQVKSFVPETFWYIYLSLSRPSSTDRDEDETIFTWRRGHLFDLHFAMVLYESVLAVPRAQIVKVTSKDTKKWYTVRKSNVKTVTHETSVGSLTH